MLFRYTAELVFDGLIVLFGLVYLRVGLRQHTRKASNYTKFEAYAKWFSGLTLIGRISFIILHSLMITSTSAYLRFILSLVQFVYIISIAILSFSLYASNDRDTLSIGYTVIKDDTKDTPSRGYIVIKDDTQDTPDISQVFESANLEEGIGQLSSQSAAIKWKHY